MKAIKLFLFSLLISQANYASLYFNENIKTTINNDFKSNYKLANEYISSEKYLDAIPVIEYLDSISPSNSNINYLLGFCYYNASVDKKKAITYLGKAILNVKAEYKSSYKEICAPPLAFYFLARSYHSVYMFKEASKNFEKYKTFLKQNSNSIKETNRWLEICQNGVKLMKSTQNSKIEIFDSTISLRNSSYSFVATDDNNALIFSPNIDISDKKSDNMCYYYMFSDEVNWSKPKKLDNDFTNINAVITNKSFIDNLKKKEFFISQNDNNNKDIYCISFNNDKFSEAIKLGSNVNTKADEIHACLSPDMNTLFFSSNKDGGYGGYDIYSSEKLSDGSWSKPYNLGPKVNTVYDDQTPFIANDGVTLYFSSKGHNTLGGFDVFISTLSYEGLWSQSENLGYPINTPLDDMFYTLSSNEKKAFYSSSKNGENNIYIISYTFIQPK